MGYPTNLHNFERERYDSDGSTILHVNFTCVRICVAYITGFLRWVSWDGEESAQCIMLDLKLRAIIQVFGEVSCVTYGCLVQRAVIVLNKLLAMSLLNAV